jgi:hypothetical protein
MSSIVPDSQSGELTSSEVGNSALDLFGQLNMNDTEITNVGVEQASDDSRSHRTITPVQRSLRQSRLDHSGDVLSRLDIKSPELQDLNHSEIHSPDTMMISGIKHAADLDSKFFLDIKPPSVIDYHQKYVCQNDKKRVPKRFLNLEWGKNELRRLMFICHQTDNVFRNYQSRSL